MKSATYLGKVSHLCLSAVFVAAVFTVSSVAADTISSPSYKINGNLGGGFGGQTSSTNYKMSAIGGETVIGQGQSGSYVIDQQIVNPSAPSMELSVEPSGMVAYYPFNENTGTASNDASANSSNGTLNGGATWATGKIGSALSLDGSIGQSFTASDSTAISMGSAMTISLWANQSAGATSKALATHWDYTSGSISAAWGLQVSDSSAGRLQFYVADSQTDPGNNYVLSAPSSWASGGWHHITVVYNGALAAADRVKIYIDGVASSTTITGTIPTTGQNAASPLTIGATNGLNRNWNGSIDHFKLFNRAFTQAEISAEYNAQNTGTPTGLTLGALSGTSTTSLVDAIVRTNVISYGLSVQQDHDLQSGANTIPGVSGTIASPATWTEGVTEGFGFTVIGAPVLDAKWDTGAKYAAFPGSATTFYTEVDHNINAAAVINLRMRLDTNVNQIAGAYTNNVVYTGTILP